MRLVSFDMDGTLIRDTTASKFMAERLGNLPQVLDLERRFDAHEISTEHFAEAVAHTFADLPYATVARHFDDVPLIGGIAETVDALKQRGVHVLIATVSYSFYARVLAERFGFHGHDGADMHEAEGVLLGRMRRHCSEHDKCRFIARVAAEQGVPLSQVAHVGDSRSDLPTFAVVGKAIALNASPDARAVAHHVLDTEHLTDVLPLLGF